LSNPESLDALLVRIPRLEGDEELAAKELIMAKMAMIEKNKNQALEKKVNDQYDAFITPYKRKKLAEENNSQVF